MHFVLKEGLLAKSPVSIGTTKGARPIPTCFHDWEEEALNVGMLWVSNDCFIAGSNKKSTVIKAKNKTPKRFDCKDLGNTKEYGGCSTQRGDDRLGLTLHNLLIGSSSN